MLTLRLQRHSTPSAHRLADLDGAASRVGAVRWDHGGYAWQGSQVPCGHPPDSRLGTPGPDSLPPHACLGGDLAVDARRHATLVLNESGARISGQCCIFELLLYGVSRTGVDGNAVAGACAVYREALDTGDPKGWMGGRPVKPVFRRYT